MKKKIQYGLITLSAFFFIFLFVNQVIAVTQILKNPDKFTLIPLLICAILLVVLLCHVGLYVMILDKKEMKFVVEDNEEWWKKWDMV